MLQSKWNSLPKRLTGRGSSLSLDRITSIILYIRCLCLPISRVICDQNLQPDCKFSIRQAESAHQPEFDPNMMKFEELDDHCFMHITSFLNIIDTVNLGKTSRRLRTVTQQIFKKRTHFSFGWAHQSDLSVNSRNIRTILQETGSFIQLLQWKHVSDEQLHMLAQYCQYVTELELVEPKLHSYSIERNRILFKNVETLKIKNAHSFDAQLKAMITFTINIRSLELINCYNVKGNVFYDWQNSQLENLKIWRCPGISPSNITHFATRANQLTKYSSDIYDSFICCLTLPARCLYNYTELRLALNLSTDEKVQLLKFDELKRLRKIHLKSSHFNRLGFDVTISYNFNKVFAAMSPIDSLNSVTVDKIIIDADTFKCLGSIKNLHELTFIHIENGLGEEMYASLHVHLPKLEKLSIVLDYKDENEFTSICEMMTALVNLKYFFHTSITWELLETIRQDRLIREQSPIEIGISELMFNDPRKVMWIDVTTLRKFSSVSVLFPNSVQFLLNLSFPKLTSVPVILAIILPWFRTATFQLLCKLISFF